MTDHDVTQGLKEVLQWMERQGHEDDCQVIRTTLLSKPPKPGPDVPGTCTCGRDEAIASLREHLPKTK